MELDDLKELLIATIAGLLTHYIAKAIDEKSRPKHAKHRKRD